MKHAILGSDASAASDQIIESSQQLKLLGIKKITLIYVINRRNVDDFAIFDTYSTQAKLDRQKNRLLDFGFEAETKIVSGPPALELMKQAKILDAGLVVIGSRGNSSTLSTLGATASESLHHIKCPVLMMVFNKEQGTNIGLLHKTMNQHVLLTTDFSDFSENAFQVLKNHVTTVPQLTLMHVQDIARIANHLEDKLEEFNQIDTARLERMKEEFSHAHPETKIRIVLDYGHPKQVIPKFIRNNLVTLTVMGSQGRGYIGEFFLGSVSLRVARHADSNVLIIPFRNQ